MIDVSERLNYLDSIMAELARAQVQSEIAFKDSGARMDALIRKMEADTAKMKADTSKMKEDTFSMKKAWGALANKMGTVAEDVVAPNIPRLAVEEFGFGEVEDLLVRARRACTGSRWARTPWTSSPGRRLPPHERRC